MFFKFLFRFWAVIIDLYGLVNEGSILSFTISLRKEGLNCIVMLVNDQ